MSFTEKDEEEDKWIMHYSSKHQILLVGERFLVFFWLSQKFGSASNIWASSLDSYGNSFISLISFSCLTSFFFFKFLFYHMMKLGASILHGVDATEMKEHPQFSKRKFDRIIFNFPHAGFYGKEEDDEVIGELPGEMHMSLVEGFFRNASGMLRPDGEVHELARKHSFSRLDCVQFRKKDYPGYNNKKGAGSQCDDHFPLRKCSTFKFGFYRARKRSKVMSYGGFAVERPKAVQEIPIQVQKRETDPFDRRYTNARSATDMNEFPFCVKFDGYKRQALMSNATFHNGCCNTPNMRLETVADDVRYLGPESPIPYERYNTEVAGFQRENARISDKAVGPGRTLNGFLYPMEGRPCEGTLRPAQPPRMRLGFSH
ncbi:Heavy metal-associated isoprenylated plant protein 41 [Citrus sinensis]|uniref:Heavy metal-associated isoprenylated plant protein 41 n=1 Tax=Citrus sinensis TaxID=2711 RepID=A0ACB8P2T5_CITSI|nr:Heavy metal-associated isoprenylated plant protein 41 [Citrus sinensis]